MNPREIRGCREPTGTDLLPNGLRRDMVNVTLAVIDGIDLFRVDIESEHCDATTGELKCKREADVTLTDDSNYHLGFSGY